MEAMSGDIQCIFLCEFHATMGTKISQSSPKNFMSKEDFDKVSNYIFPRVALQRCFISVSLSNLKILGFPIRIENDKNYVRNAFYFNLCFVFAPMTRTFGHEPIIRKCAEYLLSLELSTKFLSQLDEAKATRLENILDEIRLQINKNRHCMLKDGASMLPLCIVPYYGDNEVSSEEFAHKAPVLLDCFYENYKFEWDLTTKRIVPFVNGFRHIDKIAQMADVSLSIVVQCVKHLVLVGVAVLVPVFQYSNIYRPTPKLKILAKCPDVQQRAIEKCSKSELKKAKVRDILLLFASMTHGTTCAELCVRFNPAKHNIDERKTVLFGLVEQLIRPIYKWPVAVSKNMFVGYEDQKTSGTNNSYGIPISNKRQSVDSVKITRKSFTGLITLDEICCKTASTTRQVEEQLACDKHVIILLK